MSSLVAVIGGTGFAGAATVDALVTGGHHVRVIARTAKPDPRPQVQVVAADAHDAASLGRALEGVTSTVLCSRPDYWKWPTELVPMFQRTLDACRSSGSRLVLCDNLYAYGLPDGPLTESSPLRPHGPKGRARKEGAELLLRAHEKGEVQVAIARAADFYGPRVDYPNVKAIFANAVLGKTARLFGPGTAPHSVSYLGDVGRGLATLATRSEAYGHVWHLPVAPPTTERAFVERVVTLAGAGAKVATTPKWMVSALFTLLWPFDATLRELPEVQYQHEVPFVVDDSKFVRAFGITAVSQDEAILATLEYWCALLGVQKPVSVAA